MDGDRYLIKLVKNRPVLWEINKHRNGDSERKKLAWNEVAEKTGAEHDWIKSRWENLQERFFAAINENDDSKRQVRFKYFNEMLFLKNEMRTSVKRESENKHEFVITRNDIEEFGDESDNENIFIEISDEKDESTSENFVTTVANVIIDDVCDSTAPEPPAPDKPVSEITSNSYPVYAEIESSNHEPEPKKMKTESFTIREVKKERGLDVITSSAGSCEQVVTTEHRATKEFKTIDKNNRCEDTIFGELVTAILKGMPDAKKKQMKKEIMNVLLS